MWQYMAGAGAGAEIMDKVGAGASSATLNNSEGTTQKSCPTCE